MKPYTPGNMCHIHRGLYKSTICYQVRSNRTTNICTDVDKQTVDQATSIIRDFKERKWFGSVRNFERQTQVRPGQCIALICGYCKIETD
jgi:hypothetical protein